jgi:pentose-5-phosphate-3-epimerase
MKLLISPHRTLVSLAITSVPDEKIDNVLKRFSHTDIDLVHADFSDGSIAPGFLAEPFLAISRLAKISPHLPYDVHLFIKGISKQKDTLSKCLGENPLLRAVLLHCIKYEDFSLGQFDRVASIVEGLGGGIGIAIQSMGFSTVNLELTLQMIDSYPLAEISLNTRPGIYSLEDVAKYDLPLLNILTYWANKKRMPLFVSVDREMTLSKLSVLSPGSPSHVVVGAALLASKMPQNTILALKKY